MEIQNDMVKIKNGDCYNKINWFKNKVVACFPAGFSEKQNIPYVSHPK